MIFEENRETSADNVSAIDTEGIISTAGATVFLQPLIDALAAYGGITYDSTNEAIVLPELLAYYNSTDEAIVFGRH